MRTLRKTYRRRPIRNRRRDRLPRINQTIIIREHIQRADLLQIGAEIDLDGVVDGVELGALIEVDVDRVAGVGAGAVGVVKGVYVGGAAHDTTGADGGGGSQEGAEEEEEGLMMMHRV